MRGGQLHDTLDRRAVSTIHYVWWIGKWYLVVVLVVFGLPITAMVLNGKAEILFLFATLAFFGGSGLIFLWLQSVIGMVGCRSRVPRKVTLQSGQLVMDMPNQQKRVPISDCKWFFGSTHFDPTSYFTRLRCGIVIQTPEEHFACGHSPDMLEHWRAFLVLARIPENPPPGCLRAIGLACAGLIVGLLAGIGLGFIVAAITNNNLWRAAFALMGMFQGLVGVLMYVGCTWEGAVAARSRYHPVLVGLSFFTLAAMLGLSAGLPVALVCGSVNGLFGALVACFCRAKIDATKMERELV